MKRLVVFFSSTKEMRTREQFISQCTNINSAIFPESFKSDLLVILLGNVESKISKDLLLKKFQRNGNLVVLAPKNIKEHITGIFDKKDSRLQKNHTSSVTLIKEIEDELKRSLVSNEIADSPEQISFDEVIEFDFVQEETFVEETSVTKGFTEDEQESLKQLVSKNTGQPLEQINFEKVLEFIQKCQKTSSSCEKEQESLKQLVSKYTGEPPEQVTFEKVLEFVQKCQVTSSSCKKVTMAIIGVSLLISTLIAFGSAVWSKKQLEERFEIGISEIRAAREQLGATPPTDISKYIEMAIGEIMAAEGYKTESMAHCQIKIGTGDTLSGLGLGAKIPKICSMEENVDSLDVRLKSVKTNIQTPKLLTIPEEFEKLVKEKTGRECESRQ